VDMNLSPSWVDRLARYGFEAVQWSDQRCCDRARRRDRGVGERPALRRDHEGVRLSRRSWRPRSERTGPDSRHRRERLGYGNSFA
jgi:hypothetical protein